MPTTTTVHPDYTTLAIRRQYTVTRTDLGRAIEAYENTNDLAKLARDDDRPEGAGRWAAAADLAWRDWGRALGAADALERLADSLGVELADDRRHHLPKDLR